MTPAEREFMMGSTGPLTKTFGVIMLELFQTFSKHNFRQGTISQSEGECGGSEGPS